MATTPTQPHLFPPGTRGRDAVEPSEADLQGAVIEIAMLYRWRVIHHRPARTAQGWRTPMIGHPGWPDLVMIRGDCLLAIELKAGTRKPSAEQVEWLQAFSRVPGCRACVWTTRTRWDQIEAALRTLGAPATSAPERVESREEEGPTPP